MFREIKKKKVILDNRKPFSIEAVALIKEMNAIDWIYSSLRLDGSDLSEESVGRIIKGEFVIEACVSSHAAVSNYEETIRFLYGMVDMGIYLNEEYIMKIYQSLVKPKVLEYRKNNPVLHMLDYNPPHFKEIEELIKQFFYWYHSDVYQFNPIEKAAFIHNKIVEIYPFEICSEALARTLAQYHLISNGLPPVFWNICEQEYYEAIHLYLKKEEIQPIYDVLERGVYNKLEVMLQLTAE